MHMDVLDGLPCISPILDGNRQGAGLVLLLQHRADAVD